MGRDEPSKKALLQAIKKIDYSFMLDDFQIGRAASKDCQIVWDKTNYTVAYRVIKKSKMKTYDFVPGNNDSRIAIRCGIDNLLLTKNDVVINNKFRQIWPPRTLWQRIRGQ